MRTLVALAAAAVAAAQSNPQFTLHMLTDAVSEGAMCLDGSPTGYYFQPGVGADADKYMLYFQGGGWCYDEYDCLGRSRTSLGSSKTWAPTGSMGGMLSNDCTHNPLFCNWAKVWMVYCDGNSFSGNAPAPVNVNGTNLYFRGQRNMDATLAAVVANAMGASVPITAASKVVLTGCSAGGLATYRHADYVGALVATLPSKPSYHVIPISGFFLDHPNVQGVNVYPAEMAYAYYMQQIGANGTNAACLAAQAPGQEHRCGMAQHILPFIQSPIFPLNSQYDSWSTGCILTSEPVQPATSTANGNCSAAPGWHDCATNPDACTADQIGAYAQWRDSFVAAMNVSGTRMTGTGNGAFIVSCHTHCEAQGNGFWQFEIDGISAETAVGNWLASSGSDPSAAHTFYDCEYNAAAPRQCNPTCGA